VSSLEYSSLLTNRSDVKNEEAQEVVKASWVSVRLEGLEPPTF
jgi:hypothetical protein